MSNAFSAAADRAGTGPLARSLSCRLLATASDAALPLAAPATFSRNTTPHGSASG
jgi:hypothetical protein